MGNKQAVMSKNYGLSFQPQSCFNPNNKINSPPSFNSQHHMATDALVECYNLKTKKVVTPQESTAYVFNKPQYLTLMTYNVWFEPHNEVNRYACILRMLIDSQADFICLQEVNSTFLKALHQHGSYLTEKFTYYMPLMKMHWYDTLILSKYPCRFYKQPFQSSMGRCNLAAVIQFKDPHQEQPFKACINCVHLQSLQHRQARKVQLQQIAKLNAGMDLQVIAGDFNFSDDKYDWPENEVIKGYSDLWKQGTQHFSKWADKQMQQLGYTMPLTGRFPPWRPDHVIVRHKTHKQRPKDEIAITGDFTIAPFQHQHFSKIQDDDVVRTPSDHFALIAKLRL